MQIIKGKGYYVYFGINKKGLLVYIGTTIQAPEDRFRWHKANGKKNLAFYVIAEFDNEKEMLEKEYELIKKYRPAMNKIQDRPQNFNKVLSQEDVDARIGDPAWCQVCLKRHVSPGYKSCYYCSKI